MPIPFKRGDLVEHTDGSIYVIIDAYGNCRAIFEADAAYRKNNTKYQISENFLHKLTKIGEIENER